MNEEMRKEFEFECNKLGYRESLYFRKSVHPNHYDEDNIDEMWIMWKVSREAMKPIKLPTKMKNTQEQSCYYYNDAIEECKEAIQQAGYKVEE